MSIHEDCVKKISQFGGNESLRLGFIDLFTAIANDAEQQSLPSATFVMPMYDEDSNLQPGDWAAELHFVVRKVEEVDDDSDDGSEAEQESAEEGEA